MCVPPPPTSSIWMVLKIFSESFLDSHPQCIGVWCIGSLCYWIAQLNYSICLITNPLEKSIYSGSWMVSVIRKCLNPSDRNITIFFLKSLASPLCFSANAQGIISLLEIPLNKELSTNCLMETRALHPHWVCTIVCIILERVLWIVTRLLTVKFSSVQWMHVTLICQKLWVWTPPVLSSRFWCESVYARCRFSIVQGAKAVMQTNRKPAQYIHFHIKILNSKLSICAWKLSVLEFPMGKELTVNCYEASTKFGELLLTVMWAD